MNDETVLIKQATKQGFIECRVGGGLLTFLTLKAKQGVVGYKRVEKFARLLQPQILGFA